MKSIILTLLLAVTLPAILARVNDKGYDDEKWLSTTSRDLLASSALSYVKANMNSKKDFPGFPGPIKSCGVKYQRTLTAVFYQVCMTASKPDPDPRWPGETRWVYYVLKRFLTTWKLVDQRVEAIA